MMLITGSNGQLGRLVIDQLLTRVPASQLIAGVRSLEKGSDFAARGVAVRLVDYNQPETLAAAMVGVDKLLLISGSEAIGQRAIQHAAVIDAAKAAGVKLIAYTSLLHADTTQMVLAQDHQATERALRDSGVPFTLLRHGWYAENYTGTLGQVLGAGVMLGAAGEGRVSPALRADFAEAAAIVLTSEDQAGKIYELAGDDALTLTDLAAEIATVSGAPVRYQDLPQQVLAETLASFGLPAPFAAILADCDAAIARGELQDGGGELSRLLGRPTAPFRSAVRAALATNA